MALINRPMYEQFGARHLGVKGPGALTQLEEGVMGTLPLDMSSDPAYWFIQGIRIFGASKYVAAGGAGTFSKIGLTIENTSAQVIVKILRWATDAAEVDMYRVARTDFSSDPGHYGTGMDTRIPIAQDSQAIVISSNDALVPGVLLGQFDLTTQPFLQTNDVPIVITPGEAFYMKVHAANNSALQNIYWAEIPAYQAEL